MLDWDYEKNIDCDPRRIIIGSENRVWWKCHICFNEWSTSVYNRAVLGRGCSKCSRRIISEKMVKRAAKRNNFAKNFFIYFSSVSNF